MVKRAAIYGRNSSEKQADQQTIESQLPACEKWCADNHYEVAGFYLDEGVSGTVPLIKRREGRRLLQDAAAGAFDSVVTYAVDRWGRTRRVFYDGLDQLTDLGIGFASATQTFETITPPGRAMLGMLTTFAELDREMIESKLTGGRWTWAARTYRAPDGHDYNYWIGGRCPWGYRLVSQDMRSALTLDERPIGDGTYSQVDVVRWIYEWTVYERLTCFAISRRLNARGVPRYSHLNDGERGHLLAPTTKGCYWTEQNVAQLIRRSLYKGEHQFGLQSKRAAPLLTARFPAIVSPSLWQAAVDAMIARRTWADRNSKHLYLLRGKVRCGCCGAGFIGTARYGGKAEQPGVWWYLCQSKHRMLRVRRERDGITCTAKPIRESVEQIVWADIQAFLCHPSEAMEQLRDQLQANANQSAEIEAEITREGETLAERRLGEKRLVRLYRDGRIGDAEYDEAQSELKAEITLLKERLATLEKLLAAEQAVEARMETAAEFLARMQERARAVEDWTWEQRRAMVELWVKEVIVDPPTEGQCAPSLRIRYLFGAPQHTTDADTRASIVICCMLERWHALAA